MRMGAGVFVVVAKYEYDFTCLHAQGLRVLDKLREMIILSIGGRQLSQSTQNGGIGVGL